MSKNRELSYHGHDENDEEPDISYTEDKEDEDTVDDSSDIKNALHKPRKIKREITTRPTVTLASGTVSLRDTIGMFDTYNRSPTSKVKGTYSQSRTYANGPEEKWIPKALVYAEAGIGRAHAEYSVFEAEAKGPNVSAGAEVSTVGVGAMARAEIASASAKAGPVNVKLGLGVDTGVSAGADGFEAKILGTGFSMGPKTSISLLGSEVSCSVM